MSQIPSLTNPKITSILSNPIKPKKAQEKPEIELICMVQEFKKRFRKNTIFTPEETPPTN